MAKLKIGDPAPDFTLPGTSGPFTLSEHLGERVVLLFYPGDETTVCTKQFCSYRDRSSDIAALGATLVGISTKDVASKESFAANHGLTVPLLADKTGSVAESYGVYAGRVKMTKRAVVIVDDQGKIAHQHQNFMSLSFDSVDDIKAALDSLPTAA